MGERTGRMREITGRRGPPVKMKETIGKTKGTTKRIGKTGKIERIEKTGRTREITGRRGPPVKMKETTVKTKGTTERIGKTEKIEKTGKIGKTEKIERTGRMREITGRRGPPVKMKETTGKMKGT